MNAVVVFIGVSKVENTYTKIPYGNKINFRLKNWFIEMTA